MGQTHCDADGMLLLQRPPPLSLQSTKAVWALPSALLFTLGLQRPPGYLSFSTTVGVIMAALGQALHSNADSHQGPQNSGTIREESVEDLVDICIHSPQVEV